ncbi:MAG: DUF4037 domain-containing protein [Oscillospiraceae bacterium]|nr:DUF4037 domain-containing protein [Oscillospiraceae bacterium]
MNGLELSRAYYEAHGKPMLESQFPALLPCLAVGLFGAGSECFGYDDAVSRDHDFEPSFCLLLPDESVVDRRSEFLLERAYAKLPKAFGGAERQALSPVGGARRGVLRTAAFFERTVGSPDGRLTAQEWLTLPEQSLAEATNGAVFFDDWGEVTRIRETLAYFPEDVRRKRLAGQLLLMGQAGQYNHARCLAHGERAAARLAAFGFVQSALSAIFLLNRRYQPYYKWSFRALRELPALSDLAEPLERLLSADDDAEALIGRVAAAVAAALREQGLSDADGAELERHAYAVNGRVADAEMRNLHILAAV